LRGVIRRPPPGSAAPATVLPGRVGAGPVDRSGHGGSVHSPFLRPFREVCG
jgi:hypothetical protein